MTNQTTLNNYLDNTEPHSQKPEIETMSLPNPNEISIHYTTTDKNVYALKTKIEIVDGTQEVTWNLDDPNGTTHRKQLLQLLAPNKQNVLDTIKTYTDLRTTIPGISLGSVLINPDTGHITAFELIEVYVQEPDVQINHSALEKDLQALNP